MRYMWQWLMIVVIALGLSACNGEGDGGEKDTTPPVIHLLGDNPMRLTVGDAFTDPGAVVTDNVDANRTIKGEGSVDTAKEGRYIITYSAIDNAGNKAEDVVRTVIVGGQNPAALTLDVTANGTQECFQTEAATVSASGGEGSYTFTLGGTDAASFTIDAATGEVSFKQAPDYETQASYAIDITVTDSKGESQTQSVTVAVTRWSATHNGTIYGCVVSPYTGKVWLDRNLGAARVCESFDDTACYGDYYQWGRNFDGHQDSTSGTTSTQATDVNNAGSSFILRLSDWASTDSDGSVRAANWSKTDGSSVCPVGFRVPTIAELKAELLDAGSAQIQNRDDAFNSFLKLPSAGYRDDSLYLQSSLGVVWSSSVNGSRTHYVGYSRNAYSYHNARIFGYSVRCLRD